MTSASTQSNSDFTDTQFPSNSTMKDAKDNAITQLQNQLRPFIMQSQSQLSEWEQALFALVYLKEPKTELYVILSAMPFRKTIIDKLDMLNVMANLGHFSRPIQAKVKRLDERLLPCLIEPSSEQDDLYVLTQRLSDGWQAYNASTGVFVELKDTDKIVRKKQTLILFESYDESKTPLSDFMRGVTGQNWFGAVLSRFKGTFWQIMLIGFVLNIFALAPPIFIMMIYDRVLSTGSYETLIMLVVGMAIAIGTQWLLRHLRSRSLSWLTARLDNITGTSLFSHVINLKPNFIENASTTGQIARLRTFETARDFFSGGVFLSIIELPFTAISLLVIYLLAGPLAIVPALAAVCLLALYFVLRRRQILQIRRSARASSIRQQFILESLEKIDTIKSAGMLDLWYQKFRQLSGTDAISNFRMQWLGGIAEAVTQGFSMVVLVVLIGYGTHLIWSGDMSTGGLIASMILIWRVLSPFQSLCLSVPRIEQLRSSLNQVNQIMELETEEMAARKVSKIPNMQGKVEFDSVSMRYSENHDLVFKDVSFSLQAGQALAITGSAGTGKSTIFKLLQAMYKPETGSIRIDDFDIRQLDVHDIRRQVSYIPQIHDFFQGSILDNLRISNPLADRKQVKSALELTDALKEVEALPQGLDTMIHHSREAYMSPSFTFKLGLARMHIQQAPIVVIDNLPNQFQEGDIGSLLYKSIDRLRGKKTLLFVTFRKDYLALSDYILTLNEDKTSTLEPVDVLFEL